MCIYIYIYVYKLLNGRWFRTQGGMKRKDMKKFLESRNLVPISIGRFFFEIYLKKKKKKTNTAENCVSGFTTIQNFGILGSRTINTQHS